MTFSFKCNSVVKDFTLTVIMLAKGKKGSWLASLLTGKNILVGKLLIKLHDIKICL